MDTYRCILFFKNISIKNIGKSIDYAINNLGFSPKSMDFLSMNNNVELFDVKYDSSKLKTLLDKNLGSVTIRNVFKNELDKIHNNFSLNTQKSKDQFFMSWINKDLGFILEGNNFHELTNNENFILGHCYNHTDCTEQSTTNIWRFKQKYPSKKYKTIKGFLGKEEIDVSCNYGRKESVFGLDLMAAPIMWFGNNFFSIIPKEKLLSYKNANLVGEIVNINLFDLYDSPVKNRHIQKEFWDFFELNKLIAH